MPSWSYLLALSPALLAWLGLFLGGGWSWAVPIAVFGLVPVLDRLVPRGGVRVPGALDGAVADVILAAVIPLHLGAVVALALTASVTPAVDLVGNIVSVGILMGLYGLNVGHELGHRPGRLPRIAAQALMGSSLYAHFWVEHNRGHHARVATPEDPASAADGELLFPFWLRSITGGAISAYQLDPRWVGRAWLLQALGLALVFLALGPWAGLAWIGASMVGILLLETVNYVEHYGLRRARLPDGRWERVSPKHSWNAEHPVSRAILFDLPRHADHHAHPSRPCVSLRPFAEAPELPAGYPEMVLTALVPPLFMARMRAALVRQARA